MDWTDEKYTDPLLTGLVESGSYFFEVKQEFRLSGIGSGQSIGGMILRDQARFVSFPQDLSEQERRDLFQTCQRGLLVALEEAGELSEAQCRCAMSLLREKNQLARSKRTNPTEG